MTVYSKEYFKRWINCLFPVFTLYALYFLFIPISTIQDNQRFLNVTPDKVWLTLLLITLGLTLVFTSIVAIFKKKSGMILVSVLTGVILASFIQMLFLDSELGVLNGSYPAWKSDVGKITLNAVIWIILIALPVAISLIKKDIHSLIVKVVCFALIASQIVSVGSIALSGGKESLNDTSYVLNGKDQYMVSKNENILVFSLDTLSKDIFEAVISQDAVVAEGLKDFTYYSNTCGTYSTTFPTLVGLLTGTEYLGDASYKDYFSQSWNSDFTNTFYPALHNNGYKVNIFVDEYLTEESGDLVGKADNIIQAEKQIKPVLYARLLRISLYRLLPFCLKEYALVTPQGTVMTADLLNKSVDIIPVQNSGEKYESIRKDVTYYDEFINRGIEVDEDNNIFAWTHLMGAHSPYLINARCESVVNGSPIEQAAGYLYALEQYFDAIKDAGVYDNATIIITADHGVDPSINEDYSLFVPIIIKRPGETHDDMDVNDASISLKDLTPTLLSFVDSDYQQFGSTIFEYNSEKRERTLKRFGTVDTFKKSGWTEESNGSYNALLGYRFTGEQDELNKKIDTKDYTATQLVDSFY